LLVAGPTVNTQTINNQQFSTTTMKPSLFLPLLLQAATLFGQLDTIHWLPPMHARDDWGPQFLYLSTPETQPFPVTIRDGAGALIATVSLSNSQPYRHDLGNTNTTAVLVTESQLHQPVSAKGLVLDGPKKFYAYFRARSNSTYQACDLTCKGRAALGKVFRIGHLVQEVDGNEQRSNFVGVMATEDSTVVTLSDFHASTDFRIGGADVPATGPATVLLQAGQSVVFSQYISTNSVAQPPNGLMGSLVEASRPVAVNCGSWLGAPVQFQAYDIGVDQIAPLEKVGKEYILCRGNGSSTLEHPIVVAHTDGTQVWLNGSATPSATLEAGEYLAVSTGAYSSAGNMYIRTSEPVFMYQMIGGASTGDDALRTAGLIFVPPISCGIPNLVDNIYQPNRIGDMMFEGGLMITAMKDSSVTVSIDGAPVALGAPADVPGNPDFVTYRNLNLFTQASNLTNISVLAEGAVQVAMFGRNQPASFAAFYSGFSKTVEPNIEVALTGDGVCPDTLIATGLFDGVQWIYEDSVLQFGPDTFLVAYAPGRYIATGYLGVCRRTDFAADTVEASFVSPQFPYEHLEPSCFGYADGSISIGSPFGGLPPYQFSIDNGQSFTSQSSFDGLPAGDYRLVVRDVTGCYNRPLSLALGQPDSFYVDLTALRLPDPLKPGGEVELEGRPNRPIVATAWIPDDSTGCVDCLRYVFHPEFSAWVTLTVFDSAGCRALDSLLVIVEPNVYAPNVIRPGGGFDNDRFTLFSRAPLPIRSLAIFDRWGELVFETRDIFTNQPEAGWDGRFRGKDALPGVYVFLAEVETVPGQVVRVKGDVTVVK
jgi:hypothetical protein